MDLKLYEEIALLALNDRTGRLRGDHPRHRIAGAIIAGLILRNAARLSDDKRAVLALSNADLEGDAILLEAFDTVKAKGERGFKLNDFIGKLAGENSLIDRIAIGLCDKGILCEQTDKVLFFWDVTTYPEVDSRAESAIKQRMKDVISGIRAEDERTLALIAMAGTYGLIHLNLGNDFVREHKKRIDDIVKGNDIADATTELIDAIDAMIVIAGSSAALMVAVH